LRDLRQKFAAVERIKTKFLRHCDGFIVPGKSSFEYLGSYGAQSELIFTAPNAVDTDFFAQRSSLIRAGADLYRKAMNLPPRFFLFVGRFVREKGVFDLLAAYASLPVDLRGEVGLVFAGTGRARLELETRAAAIAPGRVQVVGFASREDLAIYYTLADALVFPTHTDPWGLVVNEAMACGLPVICSNVAGCAADLVEDTENGLIVPVGDSKQLASAMEQLARDYELRLKMGLAGRAKIEHYSPQACAAGMAQAVVARCEAA
jgi:glycosyltransferase involved in cell wall biosynthesis